MCLPVSCVLHSYFCPVACGCHAGDPHCPDSCPAREPHAPICPPFMAEYNLDVVQPGVTPEEYQGSGGYCPQVNTVGGVTFASASAVQQLGSESGSGAA